MTEDQKAQDVKKALKAYAICGGRKQRPIVATNIETGEKHIYESIEKAKMATGSNGVLQVLQGKYKQSKGHTFQYADNEGVIDI